MSVQSHMLASGLGRRLSKLSLPSEHVCTLFLSKGSAHCTPPVHTPCRPVCTPCAGRQTPEALRADLGVQAQTRMARSSGGRL